MQTGRHDKQNWQQRLDNIAADGGFNKAAAWHRLETRLEQPSVQKRIILQWAAIAAVILLTTGIIYLTGNKNTGKKDPAVVKRTTISSPAKPEIGRAQKQSTGTLSKSVPSTKEKIVIPPSNQADVGPKDPDQITVPPVQEELVLNPIINDTGNRQLLATNIVPAKKKMRVIHNNEIGETTVRPKELTDVAGSGFTLFRRKMMNEEISYSPENPDTPLKTKRSLLPFGSASSKN